MPPQSTTKAFSIVVGTPPVITTTNVPDATTGVPYSQQLTYSGGTPPVHWTFAANNATCCLSLGVTDNGILQGTAVYPGTFQFITGIVDAIGLFDSKKFTITIHPGPMSMPDRALPAGKVGQPYLNFINYADRWHTSLYGDGH